MNNENRVSLRALKNEDEKLILKWKSNEELREMLGTVYPISELEHMKWFENKMMEKNNKNFIIEQNDQAKGLLGFNQIDWINRNAEIFIFIGETSQQGMGIGKQAMQQLIDFSRKNLNLHMLYLNVFSYNSGAIKMYEKIGFNIDGRLRESKFNKGKYHDTIIMSKLLNEG
ncbi:UDP-4-amino-4,6-dideoxy-N-acetyl-beta-L-altrosamine N-acetyltransferase [Staphylococcus cohnii]|uniref:UDP-4-amino-4, 6-dideoxy-N-acetyl-beta-L-altrosamine N-acetyltransferase n=1 Tax=Staphylococcus cohnii TaxID=29382 RepID=UPI0015FB87A9|nr:UDP-4-amino-4,6-dideoxy-N-acetyl-beta-L-altrosamine N-acetyltransferase [Staphylococcus cohnii]